MCNGVMKAWIKSSHLAGASATYLEQIYELYLTDPKLVSAAWKQVFDSLPLHNTRGVVEKPHSYLRDHLRQLAREGTYRRLYGSYPDIGATRLKELRLIEAYRSRGHELAQLDPLQLWNRSPVTELDPASYGLDKSGMKGVHLLPGHDGDIYELLDKVYCGSVGAEYMHIIDAEQRSWIQKCLESDTGRLDFSEKEKITFLEELTAAELLERRLGSRFPGGKRFSLEGADVLIPLTKDLIHRAGTQGIKEIIIGMAHRGRLNMLVNVLGKRPQDLFSEFSGNSEKTVGSGDVKYHQGFFSNFRTRSGLLRLVLASNPSHLEIINPVVMGSARAKQDRLKDNKGLLVLPISIHGDSAFSGQGVVAETFNMSQTRGYKVGGTVRIVINNQVGFTTSNLSDTRSSMYCTDVAKMIQAPVFHVNADNMEAVIHVTRIALDYRNKFQRDVMIDLVCYRRHGHNESDDPSVTQPLMCQKISQHPTIKKIYSDFLIESQVCDIHLVKELTREYEDALDQRGVVVKEWRPVDNKLSFGQSSYSPHQNSENKQSEVNVERLRDLGLQTCKYPKNYEIHSRVDKIYRNRLAMANGEKMLDWAMAEILAYASLVEGGTSVRISGQDCGRGTFFHRHAVLHNQNDACVYIPLKHIHDSQGSFQVIDSVLSEEAVLAFEYGYAVSEPLGLTIWEAQFGDFANGAQVVIDQFVCSSEKKWAASCGLVMLLPHGYEGQGPEHSSARIERYLQLCAEKNMQVVVPSTPAQLYHIFRRQVSLQAKKPLVIISPKSLLRHPQCTSSMVELAEGTFQAVIPEVDDLDPIKIKRVIFCTGKVYYDLLSERRSRQKTDISVVRIEQLYPFPTQDVIDAIRQYAHVSDHVWCQEEPYNQGAWLYSQSSLKAAIPDSAALKYVGRPESASPAVGCMSMHIQQQKVLIRDALAIDQLGA